MRSDTKGYQVVEGEETTRPRPSNYLSPSRNSEDGLVNKARASVENNKLHWPPLRLAHTTPYHPYLPLDLYIIIYANLSSFECRINLRYVPVSFFFYFFPFSFFFFLFYFFHFFVAPIVTLIYTSYLQNDPATAAAVAFVTVATVAATFAA